MNIGISEHSKLIDFAKANAIAWTFIGPDDALAAGIVDDFNRTGLEALVQSKKLAAELEWSKDLQGKSWSNMAFRQQPMAHFPTSRKLKPTSKAGRPIVVKADGLALGKE